MGAGMRHAWMDWIWAMSPLCWPTTRSNTSGRQRGSNKLTEGCRSWSHHHEIVLCLDRASQTAVPITTLPGATSHVWRRLVALSSQRRLYWISSVTSNFSLITHLWGSASGNEGKHMEVLLDKPAHSQYVAAWILATSATQPCSAHDHEEKMDVTTNLT